MQKDIKIYAETEHVQIGIHPDHKSPFFLLEGILNVKVCFAL
jgi:hypothetical protein